MFITYARRRRLCVRRTMCVFGGELHIDVGRLALGAMIV